MAHVDDFFDIITRHLTRQNGDQWNSMWQTGLPYTDSTGRGTVVVKAASVALDIRVPFPPDFFFLATNWSACNSGATILQHLPI